MGRGEEGNGRETLEEAHERLGKVLNRVPLKLTGYRSRKHLSCGLKVLLHRFFQFCMSTKGCGKRSVGRRAWRWGEGRDRETERHRERERERGERERERETETETERERQRETERDRERERQRETERDRGQRKTEIEGRGEGKARERKDPARMEGEGVESLQHHRDHGDPQPLLLWMQGLLLLSPAGTSPNFSM